ncbi:MAG: cobalamin-dependent protein, partial [Deltaproteobacteria bacterium]|nr:cobalamin-dependent protein [Deltaproteobacteria bacterium]
MKILLISVNRERMPSPVFPLGLAYIARALKDGGHTIEVMDLCFSQNVLDDLKEALTRFRPDLIGLS